MQAAPVPEITNAAPAASNSAAVTAAAPAPLPTGVQASGPVAEVIKLANAGVDESVLMAYATNSTSTFNLNAEQIIYLNDLGVPGEVVTAMIQRDEELKAAGAANAAAAAPAPAPGPAAEGYPPAEAVPPQPDYSASAPAVEAPLTPPPAVTDAGFYDALAPYGAWVNINGYGQCWQPTVAVLNPGWQPYFDGGHWVNTDYGWYWLSDYSWGWGPFHYGRWFSDPRYGWCWVPDTVWGPSWVSWRYDTDYCGWAPLPPGCYFSFGFGLTFHGHRVHDFDDCGLDRHHYRFVAWNDFQHRHLHGHALGGEHVARIFDHTRVANRFGSRNHVAVNEGLSGQRVATASHTPVHRVALHEVRSGAGLAGRPERFDPARRSLTVYQPTFSRSPQSRGTLRPTVPPRPVRNVQTAPVRPIASQPVRSIQTAPVRPVDNHPVRTTPQTGSFGSGTVLSYRGPNRAEDPTPWERGHWPSQPPAQRAPLQTPAHQTYSRSYSAPAQRAPESAPRYFYSQRGYYPAQHNYNAAGNRQGETGTRRYEAPAQRGSFEVPRYSQPPAQRNYSPAPSRAQTYTPAPSRPVYSPAPHYTAPAQQASGGGNHPSPPSAPSRGQGSQRR